MFFELITNDFSTGGRLHIRPQEVAGRLDEELIERGEGKDVQEVGSLIRAVGCELEVERVLCEERAIEKFLKKGKVYRLGCVLA